MSDDKKNQPDNLVERSQVKAPAWGQDAYRPPMTTNPNWMSLGASGTSRPPIPYSLRRIVGDNRQR